MLWIDVSVPVESAAPGATGLHLLAGAELLGLVMEITLAVRVLLMESIQ